MVGGGKAPVGVLAPVREPGTGVFLTVQTVVDGREVWVSCGGTEGGGRGVGGRGSRWRNAARPSCYGEEGFVIQLMLGAIRTGTSLRGDPGVGPSTEIGVGVRVTEIKQLKKSLTL